MQVGQKKLPEVLYFYLFYYNNIPIKKISKPFHFFFVSQATKSQHFSHSKIADLENRPDILIQGCLKKDRKSQRSLYEAYKVPMFMLCLRYFNNRAEAEDVLQEGFIKIFRDLKQYDPQKGALRTWMNRVFLNTIFEHLRKKKDFIIHSDLNEYDNNSVFGEEEILADLSTREIIEMVQQLPTGYRTVFNLYVIEGFSHKEIASTMGISESSSKSQLHKAKASLKRQLRVIDPDSGKTYGRKKVI